MRFESMSGQSSSRHGVLMLACATAPCNLGSVGFLGGDSPAAQFNMAAYGDAIGGILVVRKSHGRC